MAGGTTPRSGWAYRAFASIREQPAAASITAIVSSASVTTLFAPHMVTGSAHDDFPLPGVLVWLWAMIAIVYVRVLSNAPSSGALSPRWAAEITAIWALSAVLCIWGPVLVTGTDPTRLPLTAISAPVLAALATGLVCLLGVTVRRR